MKALLYPMVLFTGLLVGLLLSEPFSVDAAGDLAKGKATYEKLCMACHGPQGKGDGPAGKVLNPPAADFTSAASKKKSEADFKGIVENGKPGTAMVAWKSQLSQTEINDVIEYVLTLRK